MKVYKADGEEGYVEVARVLADGTVEGDTDTADGIREEIEEGYRVGESNTVSEGLHLLIEVERRYNTGYFVATFEEQDFKDTRDFDESDE